MGIRVFIYDDNNARRDSVKSLIQISSDFEYAGEAPNCKNAIEDMEVCNPDVVLMDINMPEVNGIEGLRIIKTRFPNIHVLMQTVFDDSEKIFTCIRNGASGYILKKDSSEALLQAIRDVQNGGAVMSPGIAKKVLDFFKPQKLDSPLSTRESEVILLLADGLSYKMIAERLNIAYSTVNTYTKRIYEKLHVSSLGEAIAFYYKNLYNQNL
jgi:DNA-binding NarL/FixJ family response regulator